MPAVKVALSSSLLGKMNKQVAEEAREKSGKFTYRLLAVSNADENRRTLLGTGFSIGPRHLVTCRHVVKNKKESERIVVETITHGDVGTIHWKCHDDPLMDVAVGELSEGSPWKFKHWPTILCADQLSPNEILTCVGYSGIGSPLQIWADHLSTIDPRFGLLVLQNSIHKGCSGGPVLDKQQRVIGVIVSRDVRGVDKHVVPISMFLDFLTISKSSSSPAEDLQNTVDTSESSIATNVRKPNAHLETPKHKLIGREDEMKTIKKQLSGLKYAFYVLRGPPGVGKTSFTDELTRQCVREGSVDDVIWYAFPNKIGDESEDSFFFAENQLIREILEYFGDLQSLSLTTQRQLIEVQKKLRKRRYIIVIDDVLHIDLTAGRLPVISEISKAASIIVLCNGRFSSDYGFVHDLYLDPLKIDDAIQLMSEYREEIGLPQNTEEDSLLARTTSGGIPLMLQFALLSIKKGIGVAETSQMYQTRANELFQLLPKEAMQFLSISHILGRPINKIAASEVLEISEQRFEKIHASLLEHYLIKESRTSVSPRHREIGLCAHKYCVEKYGYDARAELLRCANISIQKCCNWEHSRSHYFQMKHYKYWYRRALEVLVEDNAIPSNCARDLIVTGLHALHVMSHKGDAVRLAEIILNRDDLKAEESIHVLIVLGRHHAHNADFLQACKYLDVAIERARRINSAHLEAEAIFRKGHASMKAGRDDAIELLEAARTHPGATVEIIDATLGYLADYWNNSNQPDITIGELSERLQTTSWPRAEAYFFTLLGEAYLKKHDIDNARSVYAKAKAVSNDFDPEQRLAAKIMLGMSVCFGDRTEAMLVLEMYKEGESITELHRAKKILREHQLWP